MEGFLGNRSSSTRPYTMRLALRCHTGECSLRDSNGRSSKGAFSGDMLGSCFFSNTHFFLCTVVVAAFTPICEGRRRQRTHDLPMAVERPRTRLGKREKEDCY